MCLTENLQQSVAKPRTSLQNWRSILLTWNSVVWVIRRLGNYSQYEHTYERNSVGCYLNKYEKINNNIFTAQLTFKGRRFSPKFAVMLVLILRHHRKIFCFLWTLPAYLLFLHELGTAHKLFWGKENRNAEPRPFEFIDWKNHEIGDEFLCLELQRE